jgi:hypothetical protein
MKLTYECPPNLLRFFIKEARFNQIGLAKHFSVTPAAISMAIDKDPSVDNLRRKIIDLIKTRKITVQ